MAAVCFRCSLRATLRITIACAQARVWVAGAVSEEAFSTLLLRNREVCDNVLAEAIDSIMHVS